MRRGVCVRIASLHRVCLSILAIKDLAVCKLPPLLPSSVPLGRRLRTEALACQRSYMLAAKMRASTVNGTSWAVTLVLPCVLTIS
jgi:hypothetical protein